MKRLRLAAIGCGNRGRTYLGLAARMPDRYRVAGGADLGLVTALYDEMRKTNPEAMHSSLSRSLESHFMAFAAEESRLTGKTIDIEPFVRLHSR